MTGKESIRYCADRKGSPHTADQARTNDERVYESPILVPLRDAELLASSLTMTSAIYTLKDRLDR